MPKKSDFSSIVDRLVRAAAGRKLSVSKPWDYGWSQPEYRRSAAAAMTHDTTRAVSLDQLALAAFEEATAALLRLPDISERHEAEEFWSLMASLVGTLPMDGAREEIERRLARTLNPHDSLVVLPLANVAPVETPIKLGPLTIQPFQQALADRLRAQGGEVSPNRPGVELWWASLGARADAPNEAIMTLTYQCRTQSHRALRDAEQAFEDLVAVTLALEPDLDARSLYSLRGETHRPGTRGLVLDRGALAEVGARVPEVQRELGAPAIVSGIFGQVVIHRWHGEKPFPLAELLSDPARRVSAARIMTSVTAVCRRLRVAARWHAKAHWASDVEDAVLGLGICFDAMLTEQGPSPGRTLAERYALLDPDPVRRRSRYREFQSEFYPARSSVAHGAKKTSIDTKFVRRLAREARWIFSRIWELSEARGIRTEEDYEELYSSLKWGSGDRGGCA